MKKNELKNGDIVVMRNNEMYMFVKNEHCAALIRDGGGWTYINCFTDSLHHKDNSKFDIVGVRRPSSPFHFGLSNWNVIPELWTRREVRKMTVAEICKELGYEVEVVE